MSGAVKLDSTLSKGLTILEALARAERPKGVSELARDLGLTKSNTFRLLQTLGALGYVQQTDGRHYAATLKLWQVGQAALGCLDLPKVAAAELLSLARDTGETVYLAVPEGLSVIYVDKIESVQPIRSFTPRGGSAPIHCTGTGKALLAAAYDRLRDQVKDRLTRFTDLTLTSLADLDADMAATRARGYAVDRGEYRDRIWSFGAAIRLPSGEAVAALGVSVPDVNLGDGMAERIGLQVRAAALSASAALARA